MIFPASPAPKEPPASFDPRGIELRKCLFGAGSARDAHATLPFRGAGGYLALSRAI
jgi:hypothetical protein